MTTTAVASRPASVGVMLLDQVAASATREAFRYLEGERWVSLTWQQTKDKVFELAAGMLSLGMEVEDRVAIASGTRIEWIIADLAIMCAGGATTTVYPTTQHEDVAFILADSETKIVVAEDDAQVAKVLDHLAGLPHLVKIIQIDGRTEHDVVIGWDEFVQLGRGRLAEQPSAVDDAIAAIRSDQLATLVYTSGTTGRPKGAIRSHAAGALLGLTTAFDMAFTPDDIALLVIRRDPAG